MKVNGDFMDMNKVIEGRNWDGSYIKVKIKDLAEWTKWDIHNRKNQIHPKQVEFTEKEFIK